MKSQLDLFNDLIRNDNPLLLDQIWESANPLDWKEERKPLLGTQNVINALQRYLALDLTAKHMEDWANYMEAADVILGGIGNEVVSETIYCLANPALEGALTPKRAQEMIAQLETT